jgi:hypothetical protein
MYTTPSAWLSLFYSFTYVSLDQLYSVAQRIKHASQRDANTYNNHYMPNNSGTDGQGSYLGTEVRSVVNDLFRGLTRCAKPASGAVASRREKGSSEHQPEIRGNQRRAQQPAWAGKQEVDFPPKEVLEYSRLSVLLIY